MCCNNTFCNPDSNIENFTEINRTPKTGNGKDKGKQYLDPTKNIGGNPYSSGQLNQFRTQNTMKESYTNDGAFVQGFVGSASAGQGMYDDPKVDVLSDSQRRNQLA